MPEELGGPMEARWASLYAGLEDVTGLRRFGRYVCIRGLVWAFRSLPESISSRMGAVLGRAGYWILTGYRNETIENLGKAFPDREGVWIRGVARQSMVELGANAAYAARLSVGGKGALMRAVRVRGRENLERAVVGGRGLVVISGHVGCWEILPAYLAASEMDVAIVAERLSGKLENELLRAERSRLGVGQLGGGVSELRAVVRALRRGSVVVCPFDQDAGRAGYYVRFFGRRAFVPSLPLKLAQLSGASLLPAYASKEDGVHVLTFEPPTDVARDQDLFQLAGFCASRLEGWIRERPAQWTWFHRRWRRSPDA